MNGITLVKKFLMPCGLCGVPVIASQNDPKNLSLDGTKKLVRPSELSIYVHDESQPQEKIRDNTPPSYLEQGFGTIRKSVSGLFGNISEYTDVITNTIDTGLAHSEGAINYLQEESNTLPRIGAVGVGGLTGLIFGLRGGKFKKIVYTTTGAATIAVLCYPRQAQESWDMANHYVNIVYNFVYGDEDMHEELTQNKNEVKNDFNED